jgi:hypothetical protein
MQQLGNIIKPQKIRSSDAPLKTEDPTTAMGNLSKPLAVGSQLAKSLIAFHKTQPFAEEKSQNTFFKKNNKNSTYASLEEVITICRKAVDFDLTFIQNINFEDAEYYVSTIILHSSGETLSDRTPIKCKDYNDPHKFFGSVSYARRYGLMSIFSIPTADNDGISAMGWDQPNNPDDDDDDDEEEVDIVYLVNEAKTRKELQNIYIKHKELVIDEDVKQLIIKRKGELK